MIADVMPLNRMLSKFCLFTLVFAVGFSLLVYAISVKLLWIAWLLTAGFVLNVLMSKPNRKSVILSYAALVLIFVLAMTRFLPIYDLPWSGADRIEISNLTREWQIVLNEQGEIDEFAEFGRRGSYASMVKSGYGVHVNVTHGNHTRGYYIHGNAVGNLPGGAIQTIFVPSKEGFMNYLDDLIESRGYPR